MEIGICEYAFLPMRLGMSHRTEMVNQVVFGERFEIILRHSDWTKIRLLHDNYEGWIETETITVADNYNKADDYISNEYAVSDNMFTLTKNGTSKIYLPKGSLLPANAVKNAEFTIANNTYLLEDNNLERQCTDIRKQIVSDAEALLETPYLWGGRTQWGIDCSGFVQLVYRMSGLFLQRDANQQAQQGQTLSFVNEALPGDLAFFDNEEGKITHIGIYYGNDKIIHSSKKVRIDRLDHHGIFNEELHKYTHKLRVIKNLIG